MSYYEKFKMKNSIVIVIIFKRVSQLFCSYERIERKMIALRKNTESVKYRNLILTNQKKFRKSLIQRNRKKFRKHT